MAIAQFINHFNAVRLRVTGSGLLKVKILSLDGASFQSATPVTLQPMTDRLITQLLNFRASHAQVELRVEDLDANFTLQGLIVYYRPLEVEYPR